MTEEKQVVIRENQSFSQFLKERRKELGLSQQMVAQKACVTQKTVSQIENGKENGSARSIQKILQALNVQIILNCKQKEEPIPVG